MNQSHPMTLTPADLDGLPESADWCATDGDISICGTRMREDWRRSEGVKWCFHCRTRHEFWRVLMVPDGMSYYGPELSIRGVKSECTDLFPGLVPRMGGVVMADLDGLQKLAEARVRALTETRFGGDLLVCARDISAALDGPPSEART